MRELVHNVVTYIFVIVFERLFKVHTVEKEYHLCKRCSYLIGM